MSCIRKSFVYFFRMLGKVREFKEVERRKIKRLEIIKRFIRKSSAFFQRMIGNVRDYIKREAKELLNKETILFLRNVRKGVCRNNKIR